MSGGGRPRNYAHKVLIRILPETYAKLLLLHPELVDPADPTKPRYGAMSSYVETLMLKDLASIERKLP